MNLDAISAMVAAQDGDLTKILSRLRDPAVVLTIDERELIASRLDGTLKFKRGSPKKMDTLFNAFLTYEVFQRYIVRGDKKSFAYEYTAMKVGKTEGAVRKHIEKVERYLKKPSASGLVYRMAAKHNADLLFAPNSEN